MKYNRHLTDRSAMLDIRMILPVYSYRCYQIQIIYSRSYSAYYRGGVMEDREILLARSSERDTSSISEYIGSLHPHALPLLSGSLRVEREHDRDEILISLLHPEERAEGQPHSLTAAARAFVAQYVSPAVLEVFPEWQGILLEVPA